MDSGTPLNIAVIGSGISGLSAAWLLSQKHRVTVYEKSFKPGGHSNTVDAELSDATIAVDTGFIVYNETNYPNLTALFRHLNVSTKPSEMSFAVSLENGAFEYSGTDLKGLFAQRRNIVSWRFWSMLRDILRFYKMAAMEGRDFASMPLKEYLRRGKFGRAFCEDHLLPMAAAIWSASPNQIAEIPTASFIRFCENHGLLRLFNRPQWRTVSGGSRKYVSRLTEAFSETLKTNCAASSVKRVNDGVEVRDQHGTLRRFDHVVLATHADQTLRLLSDITKREKSTLQAFRYEKNVAVLHTDDSFMPKRRAAWSSWNYIGTRGSTTNKSCVTYWMNRLQGIDQRYPLFVTLNPSERPRAESVISVHEYEHPIFDVEAINAQSQLWSLQGQRNTWFCGSYFGSGFHEDGLQSGLAVAEALGGVRRPWTVAAENGRIAIGSGKYGSPVLKPQWSTTT